MKNVKISSILEIFIGAVIVINSVLIGVETYGHHPTVHLIQRIILGIFTVEIVVRFIFVSRCNIKKFLSNGWHIFDIVLVSIGYIPESVFANAMAITALRVIRAFRILRMIRAVKEIQLIIGVLVRSFMTLLYNALFFVIFIYMFSVLGTYLFRLPTPETHPELAEKIALYRENAPPTPECSPDPYGTLSESAFTLFRITTGEDWTDLRYNLLVAHDQGLIVVPKFVITVFHTLWLAFSAFLLLNLVVAAVIGNYQEIMDKHKKKINEVSEIGEENEVGEE